MRCPVPAFLHRRKLACSKSCGALRKRSGNRPSVFWGLVISAVEWDGIWRPIEIERENFDKVQAQVSPEPRLVEEIESLWFGLRFLTGRLQTGADLKIYLLDLPREELTSAEFRRALSDEEWAVIAGLYYFGREHEEALSQISLIARTANAPFLAGLAPCPVETASICDALRQSANARWVGLGTPRFMVGPQVWEIRGSLRVPAGGRIYKARVADAAGRGAGNRWAACALHGGCAVQGRSREPGRERLHAS